ncbi:hypothetical protein CU097_000799, partial [Rhizopus azygosporus]
MSASVVKQSVANKDIQPRQKRFKVGKACFTCREKKIKCDGVQPCMQVKWTNYRINLKRPCTFSKDGMLDNSDHIADEEEKSDHVKKKIKTKNSNSNHSNHKKQKTVDILDKLANLLPGEGKEGKWEIDDGHLKLRGHYFCCNNPAETTHDRIEMPDRT